VGERVSLATHNPNRPVGRVSAWLINWLLRKLEGIKPGSEFIVVRHTPDGIVIGLDSLTEEIDVVTDLEWTGAEIRYRTQTVKCFYITPKTGWVTLVDSTVCT
jgi:hypothetical protein